MRIYNRIDRLFGPAGNTAGIVLIAVGLVMIYYSFVAIVLILVGLFAGFTSSGSVIDTDRKRIKFSNNLFGIISTGKWIEIEKEMHLGIEKSRSAWRTYSRSNRVLETENHGYMVILYDSAGKKIIPVLKTRTRESARAKLELLKEKLGLEVV